MLPRMPRLRKRVNHHLPSIVSHEQEKEQIPSAAVMSKTCGGANKSYFNARWCIDCSQDLIVRTGTDFSKCGTAKPRNLGPVEHIAFTGQGNPRGEEPQYKGMFAITADGATYALRQESCAPDPQTFPGYTPAPGMKTMTQALAANKPMKDLSGT
jgi:hypothetical protein